MIRQRRRNGFLHDSQHVASQPTKRRRISSSIEEKESDSSWAVTSDDIYEEEVVVEDTTTVASPSLDPLRTQQQQQEEPLVILGSKRRFKDITTRLRNSEEERLRYQAQIQKGDAIRLKRLRRNPSSSKWFCCLYTTTSTGGDSDSEDDNDDDDTVEMDDAQRVHRLVQLQKKLQTLPKRHRQRPQIIAPLARECLRLLRHDFHQAIVDVGDPYLLESVLEAVIPSEFTVRESEVQHKRPNRTLLNISRHPWTDLEFFNKFGTCRSATTGSSTSITAFGGSSGKRDEESKERKKKGSVYAEFDIALLVSGFGQNRKAADVFASALNHKSRGKLPRLALGTLLGTKWNFECYGSLDAVFDTRFRYYTLESVHNQMRVVPRVYEDENSPPTALPVISSY